MVVGKRESKRKQAVAASARQPNTRSHPSSTNHQPIIVSIKKSQHYDIATRKNRTRMLVEYREAPKAPAKRIYIPWSSKNTHEERERKAQLAITQERKRSPQHLKYLIKNKQKVPIAQIRKETALQAIKSRKKATIADKDRAVINKEVNLTRTPPQRTVQRSDEQIITSIRCSLIVKVNNNTPFYFPHGGGSSFIVRSRNVSEDGMLRSILGSDYSEFQSILKAWKTNRNVEIFYGWTYTKSIQRRGESPRLIQMRETLFTGRYVRVIDRLRG